MFSFFKRRKKQGTTEVTQQPSEQPAVAEAAEEQTAQSSSPLQPSEESPAPETHIAEPSKTDLGESTVTGFREKPEQIIIEQAEAIEKVEESASDTKRAEDTPVEKAVESAACEPERPETATPLSTNEKAAQLTESDALPDQVAANLTEPPPAKPEKTSNKSLFSSLREKLGKTRHSLTDGLVDLMLGRAIDEDLIEELETRLLMADVGVDATRKIIGDLTNRVSRRELKNANALLDQMRLDMRDILLPCNRPLVIPQSGKPFVLLIVGINGAGKTTTIGKLAKRFQNQGLSVMLAAGDTFRAAAVEQLQTWGQRNNVPVVAQHTGADSASVIYDAVQSAQAKDIDVVIADTAGRLHTQVNLMDELKKVKRVVSKLDAEAPHEIMLVIDASFGQNALIQARQFHDALGVTGLAMTKLDGTAKGGVLLAIANKLELPIRFIGIGESVDDLREFDAQDFVDALLDRETLNRQPAAE